MAKALDYIPLKWRVLPNGCGHVADAPNGLYSVTYEADKGYCARFAGYQIALAQSLQGAQDYALIHLNRK